MGVKQRITIAFIITLTAEFPSVRCQKRALTRDAVASVLQDILSPCNADKALQFMKMAATGTNRQMGVPEIANAPRAIVTNEIVMPPRIITNANEIGMPRRAIISNGEMVMPAPAMVTNSNGLAMPARAIIPNTQIAQPIPMQQIQQVKQVIQPRMVEPLLLPNEIYQSVGCAVPCPQEVYQYQTPVSVGSPYFPAASPVSAMAPPYPSMLPPAIPNQSRGQFLRKIPIPPPSL